MTRLENERGSVQRYLLELTGNAGVFCWAPDIDSDPDYQRAVQLYMCLPSEEINEFVGKTFSKRGYAARSGKVVNYRAMLKDYEEESDVRSRKNPRWKKKYREYLDSPVWERKREIVKIRAMRPRLKDGICVFVPTCEAEGCENEVEHIHHTTYDNVGKEELKDLKALCRECHGKSHIRGK